MAVKIAVSNSSFTGNSKALNDIKGSDISIDLDKVKVDNAVEMLNKITDTEVGDIVNALLAQQERLSSNEPEYQTIQNLREDVKQNDNNIKEILKKYLPNLVTSTVANILGKLIL